MKKEDKKYFTEYFERAIQGDPRHVYQTMNSFKKDFVLFTGPMFGGKTTRMLSELDRYRYKGRHIYAFKPRIDNRYAETKIVSHNGGSIDATTIECADDIINFLLETGDFDPLNNKFLKQAPVIALDEVFMVKKAGEILPYLFRCGATIIASTIQLNSDGNPFYEILNIMPYATRIEVCTAVCSICGADAHYTEKIGGKKDFEVEVGGKDLYQPKCFYHFSYF